VTRLLALAVLALVAADRPAARVGSHEITLRRVDARCGEPCAKIDAEIRERKWAGLNALVDEALLAGLAPPATAPVADAEIDAYVAEHRHDFHGPAARDRAAVRFFLERERRRARDAELAAREREKRPPELLVTADDPALSLAEPARVLARGAGREVRDRDVEQRLALVLYRLRGALQRERLRQVESLIDDTVWAEAARAKGTSPEGLRASVVAAAPPVTDADVERYYETEVRKRDPEAEKRLDRLRPYLEFQRTRTAETAFLQKERARLGVAILLKEPAPPRLRTGPGPGGWRGPADDPVRVVFLTSFRGETSRAMWKVVRQLAEEPGVALAVRPLLPQWDPEATAVAAAVYCATEHRRFWEMVDAAASHPTLPDGAALALMAEQAGIAREPFEACLARPETSEAVARDSAEAEALGLTDPPALLVDGLVFGGMQSVERLRAAVREARATKLRSR
jgi:protein-disulfide isomerase